MTACRLIATPGPRPSVGLRFEFVNDGSEPWTGRVFEPAIPWDLAVRAGGEEVRVRQPPLDVASRARRLSLAPGETAEVECPILLVFEGGEPPPDDPFVWVLAVRPPVELELSATIGGPGESHQIEPARVRVDGPGADAGPSPM